MTKKKIVILSVVGMAISAVSSLFIAACMAMTPGKSGKR